MAENASNTAELIYDSDVHNTVRSRFREVWAARHLLWSLAWRDVMVRYKQSVLGIGWAMFVPLIMMLLFTFVFTRIVPVKTDVPYAIFAYCGLLPWTFFSASTTAAVNSLVANRALVTKIYAPAEVFPLSSIGASFIDFLVGGIVLAGLMAYFLLTGAAITVSWTVVLVVPIILVQILFTAGVSFFLATGNLFFRDVRYVYNVLVTLWMFASSVIYPMKVDDPTVQAVLNLNPMTPILDAYRDVLLRGLMPEWRAFGYATAVAVVSLILGWIVLYRMQHRFAEKV